MLVPEGNASFSEVSQASYVWELSSFKYILSSSAIKLLMPVFLGNFSVGP